MKINFTPETYEALINRANQENKAAAALVSELITAILNKEENNEDIHKTLPRPKRHR